MTLHSMSELFEKRRNALIEYCLGQVGKGDGDSKYNFLRTPADLFELLRMDPLDSYPVQSSWVAEATSCAQQFIHAAYRKLEPGYEAVEFDKRDLATWELYSNYPDWAALQLITLYPENFITPFVRQRKTSLFKTLENNLNQAHLNIDSVQAALQDYLQTFEQTCNLDVLSSYMDGTPERADYYFVGRQRVPPFQYFWRKAEVELSPSCVAINPAAWSEWLPVDTPTGVRILDIRPVFWSGRLCLVWAEWQDKVESDGSDISLPHRLEIKVAFMSQNGQWSSPLSLHSSASEADLTPGARLIATIWADYSHPKGRLGVLLTNDKTKDKAEDDGGDGVLKVFAVRDVLFRPLAWDDGGWLEQAAKVRFVDANAVQHPLMNQPRVSPSVETAGRLTPFLDLQAVAFRVDNDDVLFVQGFLRPSGETEGQDETFDLTLEHAETGDQRYEDEHPVAGGWSTDWLVFRRSKGSWGDATFSFGTKKAGYGRKKFVLGISNVTAFAPVSLLKNGLDAAQFLSLNQPELTLKYTRLNSLFGPELVQRSNVSVDAVLDWDTQFLPEPPPGTGPINEPNGAFDGANGLFFWELFFHLPHLVAARLRAEDRFLESQNWLHYLFDPQAPADATQPLPPNPRPLYWRCRPLAGPGNLGCETMAPTDPDAIAYSAPKHFQILVFCDYVKNLIAWGDWYYRQLTRDSLVAAKLCYVQAEFLMGKAPSVQTVNRWEADTVNSLMHKSTSRPALEQFERNLPFSLSDFPAAAEASPQLGLLANDPFKPPINEQVLALYDLPGQRLHNLRSNLTLDGKPLDIPLFSPPTDPNQLLRDLAAGGAGAPRPMGGRLVVGAFRWRTTFEVALRAVQTLQEHGEQVLRLLERRDQIDQEDMQQNYLLELGAYAQTMQEQSLLQLQETKAALEQSQAVAQEREDAYKRLYEENVSAVEYKVMDNLYRSKILSTTSASIRPGGAAIAALANIFGVANGGFRLDKVYDVASFALDIAAAVLQIDAEKQATTESYRRRREEWQLQCDQAKAEVQAIEKQVAAQSHAVTAAQTSLDQTLIANSQALTVYNFLKKRATNAELYGWLLGQFKALHYQAYDAVVSLCLSAQASLSAETGDYDTQIPLPQVWLDNRHGLTAGEHLRAHLMRMEREYLQRFERRLELVKTISLRQLFDDENDPQTGIESWEVALQALRTKGTLEFKLTQLLFDRDYPGHYCRQIDSVEVDLPVLTGPYDNVRATLRQISSMTATKASVRSVDYLHRPEEAVAPTEVQINLRSGQQIALSLGIGDSGMTALKPEESLLNPFENTGVVSRWMLTFPRPGKKPQCDMLRSLTDIIVRLRYTAKAGESPFARAVEDRVTELDPGAAECTPVEGAGRHE